MRDYKIQVYLTIRFKHTRIHDLTIWGIIYQGFNFTVLIQEFVIKGDGVFGDLRFDCLRVWGLEFCLKF